MSFGKLEFGPKTREILSSITSFVVVILDLIQVILVTVIYHGLHISKNISVADAIIALAIVVPLVTFVHHLAR